MHSSRPLTWWCPCSWGFSTFPIFGENDGVQLNALLSMNARLFFGASNKVRRLSGSGHGNGSPDSSQHRGTSTRKQSGASAIILHMNVLECVRDACLCANSDIRRGVPITVPTHDGAAGDFRGGLSSVCEYMAKAICDVQPEVAIEACEFWFALIHHSEAHVEVRKNIVKLVQGAISKCVLTQDEIFAEREDEELQATGEKKIHFRAHGEGGGGSGFSEESSTKYTIRRSAALLLDNISQLFPDETASISLESIEVLLQTKGELEEQALQRECGMLVLGAIASGCEASLASSLPAIFPFFLEGMGDALPEVRAISAGCSRDSAFIEWRRGKGLPSCHTETHPLPARCFPQGAGVLLCGHFRCAGSVRGS